MQENLPYKVATLLFCFNSKGETLLLERKKAPNQGLWSPCGGKLLTEIGESPYACAIREAREELGVELMIDDISLTGVVSECGYEGTGHWLIFLFEVLKPIDTLPEEMQEGRFRFFAREDLENLKISRTDREQIWPLFWKHRGGFFSAHCHTDPQGQDNWTIEETKADLRQIP